MGHSNEHEKRQVSKEAGLDEAQGCWEGRQGMGGLEVYGTC